MGDYRRLKVWPKARLLRKMMYEITKSFPGEERFGLTAQVRRASVSIMANLAEGCGRNRDGEMLRFVQIALGSAAELECLLIAAQDEGYVEPAAGHNAREKALEVKRMLAGLANHLRGSLYSG